MKKILLFGFLMVSYALAECSYSAKDFSMSWTAFKTPLKVGVSGTFDKNAFHSTSNSDINSTLVGSSVSIPTSSVNTKNEGRDKTLVKSFFSVLEGEKIDATIVKVESTSLDVQISLNGVEKIIPMSYNIDSSTLYAKGFIDLADFSGLKALKSINKACYDLHKGKTWSDVEITFTLNITKNCKG